jgi:hypothetical protein
MQIRTKGWDRGVVVGSLLLVVIGFGGIFLLQAARSGATTTLWFIVLLGVLTFVFFAGPGIAFAARKRIPWVKQRVPGGTLAWVRAHLYLPILALIAAWVHASSAPFRTTLSSGKVLLALGVIVSVAGVARHHLIGVTKSAVNADAQISKIAAAQPRSFRRLVIDYKQLRRPLADIQADAARLPVDQAAAWAKVVEIQQQVDDDFPRGGGQSGSVRMHKLLRSVHAPLTILLFLVLGFHVVDTLGVTEAVTASAEERFSDVQDCADCHSEIADEWGTSSMSHAQTGTIMEAQLPVTLAKNEELARQLGADQEDLFEAAAQVCVNCHAPVGAQLLDDDPTAVLPFDEATDEGDAALDAGGAAVMKDGIGCIVCHSQESALGELAGAGPLNIDSGTRDSYGTIYGPLFDDPNPLPVRVHDIGDTDPDGFWNDPIATSVACGACHNVKLDIDGDGLSPFAATDTDDDDGDNILNTNELDNVDGTLDDLVLQTTFDEWEDYVATFDDTIGAAGLGVDEPLGCIDCHMPSNPGGVEEPVVDAAPGMLTRPERPRRSHSFIGVDYDLDPAIYTEVGLDPSVVNDILAERAALLQTAITLSVGDAAAGADGTTQIVDVTVRNNLLGHTFPTGFAFARQFWIEVSAQTVDGRTVCLTNPFVGVGASAPCISGEVADRGDPVPQCDPASLAASLGVERSTVPNGAIEFTDALPVGECDPWLANFQKILTDGDPDGDGVFTEVAYQSFLPDIVKVRERVVDRLRMDALQSTRLVDDGAGGLRTADSLSIPYEFDAAPGTPIIVTATMHFRHLPPEFIRSLAREQRRLDNVTPSARIDDPEALVANLAITPFVTARTGDGEVLACEGPQNDEGATILDCLENQRGLAAVDLDAAAAASHSPPAAPSPLTASIVGLFAVAGVLAAQHWGRRRPAPSPAVVTVTGVADAGR